MLSGRTGTDAGSCSIAGRVSSMPTSVFLLLDPLLCFIVGLSVFLEAVERYLIRLFAVYITII